MVTTVVAALSIHIFQYNLNDEEQILSALTNGEIVRKIRVKILGSSGETSISAIEVRVCCKIPGSYMILFVCKQSVFMK